MCSNSLGVPMFTIPRESGHSHSAPMNSARVDTHNSQNLAGLYFSLWAAPTGAVTAASDRDYRQSPNGHHRSNAAIVSPHMFIGHMHHHLLHASQRQMGLSPATTCLDPSSKPTPLSREESETGDGARARRYSTWSLTVYVTRNLAGKSSLLSEDGRA